MDKKIRIIFWVCTLTVIVCAVWSLVRTLRPSRGKPYERVTAQEAQDYMSYETDFYIVDVRDEEAFAKAHVDGAISLPLEEIVEEADRVLPDRDVMIYVYGDNPQDSCAAAQKLSDIGYSSITETGSYQDWAANADSESR